jgi:hypothetical protein
LAGPGAQTPLPTVASLQADGTIKLDFGEVPRAQRATFDDVVRMTSRADRTTNVSLAISGPAGAVVQWVGFWEGTHGSAGGGLTLKAGHTEQLAFGLYAPSHTHPGELQGSLTITASLADGRVQQRQLPIVIDVVTAH